MTIRRTRITCWISEATNTLSEYVMLISFPRHEWLLDRAPKLCFTYIVCLVPPPPQKTRSMGSVRSEAFVTTSNQVFPKRRYLPVEVYGAIFFPVQCTEFCEFCKICLLTKLNSVSVVSCLLKCDSKNSLGHYATFNNCVL
jgi:hypothetical protein